MNDETFINFGKYKVIIVSAIVDGEEFNYHHNILITNNTSFEQYYNKVKDILATHFNEGYQIDVVETFKILVWNMDEFANKNIKITSSTVKNKPGIHSNKTQIRGMQTSSIINKNNLSLTHFTPLKDEIITPKPFATMDIETMEFNSKQIPVAISIYIPGKNCKIFILDSTINIELAINKLWIELFDYITQNFKGVIFVHNLGSFDGLYIYKYLSGYTKPENVSSIIDDKNKFIQISLNNNIFWKDSFRIFPVSLNDLCTNFGVDGKSSKYKNEFNNFNLFNNNELLKEFINYSIQDSISLYKALEYAQNIYINNYQVDITTIFSTSTLSLKIYRTNFQDRDINIPTLKGNIDNFIRKGYFGGGTDYYKAHIENGKYYDINSLYPHAMSNLMPFEMIKYHNNMNNIKLSDFFGFVLAQIHCPSTMLRPVLPYKYEGKTIYPTGYWIGIYFSEELKAVEKLGYKITLIKGYEFSKIDLFSKYIDHFFEKKKFSSGATRFIAKMHLNQLYGYFGRRQDLIETINVFNKDLNLYASYRLIKTIIRINNEISTILLHCNINQELINELNNKLELKLKSNFKIVKTNVSISAAVTAYARIHMIHFKLLPGTVYTDTDSIFTTDILPDHLIGRDIGLMKDELDGNTILEGYFLGIKQYGYKYLNNNQIIEKSTFAGVPKNSLTFNEVINLFNGESIIKIIPIRFFKSFINLSINIKPTKITIKKNSHKKLLNNIYLPINVFNLNNSLDNRTKLIKLANKIYKFLKYIIFIIY
jgi:hypothetical protein